MIYLVVILIIVLYCFPKRFAHPTVYHLGLIKHSLISLYISAALSYVR